MKYLCWVCRQEVHLERKDTRGNPPVLGVSYDCAFCGAYMWWLREGEL